MLSNQPLYLVPERGHDHSPFRPPHPWQQYGCSLSLHMCLVWTFHISWIIQAIGSFNLSKSQMTSYENNFDLMDPLKEYEAPWEGCRPDFENCWSRSPKAWAPGPHYSFCSSTRWLSRPRVQREASPSQPLISPGNFLKVDISNTVMGSRLHCEGNSQPNGVQF